MKCTKKVLDSGDIKEEFILPNGIKGEFYLASHTYIIEGEEVPSITTLISQVYGDSYASVNPTLLQRSAAYGTKVHDELSNLIELRKISPDIPLVSELQEVNNYFKIIEPVYKVEPVLSEQIVVLYDDNNKPVAAGRFDLMCQVKGKLTLSDFKTTSQIHKKLVTAQLNLYLKAAYQSGYIENMDLDLTVIHLSGSQSKMVPIMKLKDEFFTKFINR